MSYLLSIVIPTKDRYKYLLRTLMNLCKLDRNLVEIVVQDNTCNNKDLVSLIDEIESPNIKYYHEMETLSQTANSELAVSHASGEYCCYIGDDDTVMPEILEYVKKIKEMGLDACACDEANYYWPDVVFEKKRAWLKYNTKRFRTRVLDSSKVFTYEMSFGMQDITLLPRVYHGIVSKKVLNRIHEIAGTYFPGPSPDMANATACALVIDKYLHTEMPLIFSGVGYTSGAGMGERGVHKGDLKNAKQLPKDAEEKWSNRIPKIWLGYTVWAESAEKAMIAMECSDLLNRINIVAMEAKIFLKYREYRNTILNRISSPIHAVKFTKECIRFMFKYFYGELVVQIRARRGFVERVYEPLQFEKAYEIVANSNIGIS